MLALMVVLLFIYKLKIEDEQAEGLQDHLWPVRALAAGEDGSDAKLPSHLYYQRALEEGEKEEAEKEEAEKKEDGEESLDKDDDGVEGGDEDEDDVKSHPLALCTMTKEDDFNNPDRVI